MHLLFCFPKIHLVRYSPVYYSLLQTAGFQNVFPQYPLVYQFLLFPFQLHAQHILVTYLSNFIVYCWDPFSTINHYVHVGNVYLPRASPAIAAAAANPLKFGSSSISLAHATELFACLLAQSPVMKYQPLRHLSNLHFHRRINLLWLFCCKMYFYFTSFYVTYALPIISCSRKRILNEKQILSLCFRIAFRKVDCSG